MRANAAGGAFGGGGVKAVAPPDPVWIAAQRRASARELRRACSATGLERFREGFGWRVRPARGSVLASCRIAAWDPEPDYFHHWIRDSAIVLRAVPLAMAADPQAAPFWRGFVADFIVFALAISDPARQGPRTNPLAATSRADHARFLRPDAELSALTGAAWLEEPRFAPDGTPDPENWSRPQDDGPALRASALMAVLAAMGADAPAQGALLLERDLAHVLRVAGRPAIGPWEEAPPRCTSFTLIAQWDALDRGAALAAGGGTGLDAAAMRDKAAMLAAMILSMRNKAGALRESINAPEDHLDSATCLALLHADRAEGPFALDGALMAATRDGLDRIFAALYPINAGETAPAVGRWRGDLYFEGQPWYPATLGFAAIDYRIAAMNRDLRAFARAEARLALVARVAPRPAGPLPEQFDRDSGVPRSCLALSWSAAAFLEAAAARDQAVAALAPDGTGAR